MEELRRFQGNLLGTVNDSFIRQHLYSFNWDQKLMGIMGPRGSGKTTLMLQQIKYKLGVPLTALYVTADHPWFYTGTFFQLAQSFSQYGGKNLFIDEVHKYPNWSRELKNIYDGFPGLKVVFTASSALEIFKGESDLSRRITVNHLPGLSFREFLEFHSGLRISSLTISEILENHLQISEKLVEQFKPLPAFKKYLSSGYFPFSKEIQEADYHTKLIQVINTVLESDLSTIQGYSASAAIKIKKLLGIISESAPFEPNISSLAGKMSLGRDTVNVYLRQLENAKILNLLHKSTKGISALQKPAKIFLDNTNWSHALKSNPSIGTQRETFFLNQLRNAGHQVEMPPQGDFLVDGKWLFEIGGKTKRKKGPETGEMIIAADEIETGFRKKIPLWMFGLLY